MSGLETIHTVVFAETENGGNPCPVTFGAEKLTDEELLAMAKEFDMECLFIVPSGVPGCAARFRYFTPGKELASCGHATIAGVSVLLKEGKLAGDSARIETASGPMEVSWEEKNGEMYVTMDQFLPEYGPVLYRSEDRREAAEALGLTEGDLADFLPLQNVSTSRPKTSVTVRVGASAAGASAAAGCSAAGCSADASVAAGAACCAGAALPPQPASRETAIRTASTRASKVLCFFMFVSSSCFLQTS